MDVRGSLGSGFSFILTLEKKVNFDLRVHHKKNPERKEQKEARTPTDAKTNYQSKKRKGGGASTTPLSPSKKMSQKLPAIMVKDEPTDEPLGYLSPDENENLHLGLLEFLYKKTSLQWKKKLSKQNGFGFASDMLLELADEGKLLVAKNPDGSFASVSFRCLNCDLEKNLEDCVEGFTSCFTHRVCCHDCVCYPCCEDQTVLG